MMTRPWKLLAAFAFTFLLVIRIEGQRGAWDGFNQLLERLKGSTEPATFSPTTDCAKWLRKKPQSIVYNYGLNHSLTGAAALRDCLLLEAKPQERENIREISLAFTTFDEVDSVQQPLQDLLDNLPSLESISCPRSKVSCRNLVRAQYNVRNASWDARYDFGRNDFFFIECSSDSLISRLGDSHEPVRRLYKTLVACPNVRSLSLSLSQGGCEVSETPRSFDWKKGDRFPTLENLTLSGYDWNSMTRGTGKSNAEFWKEAMDWSQLKRLDLSLPPNSFLETFRNEFDSLISLSLRPEFGFWGDEITLCEFDEAAQELRQNYTSFVVELPPLRELSISGMGQLLNMTPIMQAHGASLEKLAIHELENKCKYATYNATWARPVLSVSDLEEINTAAPKLQTLTLDVRHNRGKWPVAIFRALSKFSNVSDLKIYVDLEDRERTKFVNKCYFWKEGPIRDEYCKINELMEPQLNHTTAQEVFNLLRQNKVGEELRNITLIAGDYGQRHAGGMRLISHNEDNTAIKYNCWIEGKTIECRGQRHDDMGMEEFIDEDID